MGKYKDINKETRAGNFLRKLKDVAPEVLDAAANITGIDQLRLLSKAIKGSNTITPQDKETALALLKMDEQEMIEITKRWEADMVSDSWLSKNVRPMALIFLTLFMVFIIFTDSKVLWDFEVKESYIKLLETLLLAVYLAYFGSRGVEKYTKIKK